MSFLPGGILKKTVLKCTTMSINERFTQLRGGRQGNPTLHRQQENIRRENNAALHQASIKNRRLAQQMERRPTVMAALKIKKKSLRQRLGPFDNNTSSVQSRLLLPQAGLGRGIGLRGGRGRLQGTMTGQRVLSSGPRRGRTTSLQLGMRTTGRIGVLASPRGIRRVNIRHVGNRGRVVGQAVRGGGEQIRGQRRQRIDGLNRTRGGQALRGQLQRRVRGQLQGRGGQLNLGLSQRGQPRRGQLRGQLRGQSRGRQSRGGQLRGQSRGGQLRGQSRGGQLRRGQLQGQFQREKFQRGQFRRGQAAENWGQSRPFGRAQARGNQTGSFHGRQFQHYNQPKPSKEDLDLEIDQYMSNTQSHLNNSLDVYMKEGPWL